MSKRRFIIITILSFLYSFFCVIGNSFVKSSSLYYIKNNFLTSLLTFISLFVLFFIVLHYLFLFIENKKKKNNKKISKLKLFKLFDEHTFLFCFIVLIICWLPYIIAFYPVILSPDPSFQIKQFFGIPNKYSTYNVLLDPNVIITNHHPVVHTLLLGSCLKIGNMIGNDNLGLFLYSIIQITVLVSVLSYVVKFLKELKLNTKYVIGSLLVFALVPAFPIYSMSAVKDVIFGSLIILYIISLYKLLKTDNLKIKNIVKILFLMILIVLFRNNGIHTILLSFPFLLFLKKGNHFRKKILLILLIIFGFNYSYSNLILPYFKITPTSVREMLSIPFQQTARYVKEHSIEVTSEEEKAIDKILTYDTLADRYNPELADPVKNSYNKYATKEDLKEYFKVWFNQFIKHPGVYIEATLNNTYGYFYPLKTSWYFHSRHDTRIVEDGFKYSYSHSLKGVRDVLSGFGNIFPYIPLIGLLINIAFNAWILLFLLFYLIYKKKYSSIIYLLPSLVLLLICFASPANTYFRYALPFIFALPLNIGIFIKTIRE